MLSKLKALFANLFTKHTLMHVLGIFVPAFAFALFASPAVQNALHGHIDKAAVWTAIGAAAAGAGKGVLVFIEQQLGVHPHPLPTVLKMPVGKRSTAKPKNQ